MRSYYFPLGHELRHKPHHHRPHRQQLGRFIGLIICIVGLLMASTTMPANAESIANSNGNPDAASLFDLHCAGCHSNGGNIIRRGKNLKKRAMTRNGYGDVEAIKPLIMQGKGAMPAFDDRLSAEEVSAIATYVHQKAETGW